MNPAETAAATAAEAFSAEAGVTPTVVDSGADALVATPQATNANGLYTAEDLAKVRSQEKDKLYPQLDKLKSELEALKKEREAEIAAKQAEREALEAEERSKAEADMDVRELLKQRDAEIKQRDAEWQEKLEHERQERERAFALLDREKTFADLQAFTQTRLDEERDNIIPELVDLITGNTQDEIDASIEGLKARSARILEAAQQSMQTARKEMTGSRITAPPTGPLDTNTEQQSLTAAEIAAMPMNEYAKYRQRLLSPSARGVERGLFG